MCQLKSQKTFAMRDHSTTSHHHKMDEDANACWVVTFQSKKQKEQLLY
jgi:hypothetical protein